MRKSNKPGFVYVFANPSFPEWVKVGKTKNWKKRIQNGNTYTPFDFYPVAILETKDMDAVESEMHETLKVYEEFKKEFFHVKTGVRRVLELLRVKAKNRGELSQFVVFKSYKENEDVLPDYTYDNNGRQIKIKANPKLYDVVFHAARKGSAIRMRVVHDKCYVVLKGGRLEPMSDALLNSDHPARVSIRKERERLEEDPKKVNDKKQLVCDVTFRSSSRALAVMLGCSAMQGPAYWLDENGKPLADYL